MILYSYMNLNFFLTCAVYCCKARELFEVGNIIIGPISPSFFNSGQREAESWDSTPWKKLGVNINSPGDEGDKFFGEEEYRDTVGDISDEFRREGDTISDVDAVGDISDEFRCEGDASSDVGTTARMGRCWWSTWSSFLKLHNCCCFSVWNCLWKCGGVMGMLIVFSFSCVAVIEDIEIYCNAILE